MNNKSKREQAIFLRIEKQMSYSQIKEILGVSKSTLSYWLRNYPLSTERIRQLRDRNSQRIEKFRLTMQKKKEERIERYKAFLKDLVIPTNLKELAIAGFFLYWGEGSKTETSRVALSNSDPRIIKFFVYWLNKVFKVPTTQIYFRLHLYKDMDVHKEISFWSDALGISRKQFVKPYIKSTSYTRINYKGQIGHGTCYAYVSDARLCEQVLAGIRIPSEISMRT